MFNKFKSKKEEARYEEVYQGTDDELYEEDLDATQKELEEAALMGFNSVKEYREYRAKTFGEEIPTMPEYNGELDEGIHIAENGEIVRSK